MSRYYVHSDAAMPDELQHSFVFVSQSTEQLISDLVNQFVEDFNRTHPTQSIDVTNTVKNAVKNAEGDDISLNQCIEDVLQDRDDVFITFKAANKPSNGSIALSNTEKSASSKPNEPESNVATHPIYIKFKKELESINQSTNQSNNQAQALRSYESLLESINQSSKQSPADQSVIQSTEFRSLLCDCHFLIGVIHYQNNRFIQANKSFNQAIKQSSHTYRLQTNSQVTNQLISQSMDQAILFHYSAICYFEESIKQSFPPKPQSISQDYLDEAELAIANALSIYQSINQSINQTTNQASNQPISKSINQSLKLSIQSCKVTQSRIFYTQATHQSINKSINKSISQAKYQSSIDLLTALLAENDFLTGALIVYANIAIQQVNASNQSIDQSTNQSTNQMNEQAISLQLDCVPYIFRAVSNLSNTTPAKSANQSIIQSTNQSIDVTSSLKKHCYKLFVRLLSINQPINQSTSQSGVEALLSAMGAASKNSNALSFIANLVKDHCAIDQSISQSINQSTTQSINQSVSRSPIPAIDVSIQLYEIGLEQLEKSVPLLASQSINETDNPSVSQTENQSISQTKAQSINQLMTEKAHLTLNMIHACEIAYQFDRVFQSINEFLSINQSSVIVPINKLNESDNQSINRLPVKRVYEILRILNPFNKSNNQFATQSINESVNQSVNQSVSQSEDQLYDMKPIKDSGVSQVIVPNANQSVNQALNQLINQQDNKQSINQSTNQSTNQPLHHSSNIFNRQIAVNKHGKYLGGELHKPFILQSINQSVDQSINQSVNQSTYETINQSESRALNLLGMIFTAIKLIFLNQSVNQSINRSMNRSKNLLLIELIEMIEPVRINQSIHLSIIRNEHAYYSTCAQLWYYQFQSINQSISQSINQSVNQSSDQSINQSADLPIIHVIGDSHSLSSGWSTINLSIKQSNNQSVNQSDNQSINQTVNQSINQSVYFKPYLVTGCKCWHLRSDCSFYTRAQFSSAIRSINQSINQSINRSVNQSINQSIGRLPQMVLWVFGEIDCREGILNAVNQSKYQSINEAINLCVDTYIEQVQTFNRSINQSINQSTNQSINQSVISLIHPIVPVLDVTRPMVKQFNAVLKQKVQSINQSIDQSVNQSNKQSTNQSISRSIIYLDFFDDLLLDGSFDVKQWGLDGTHLHPKYIKLIQRELQKIVNHLID